MSKNIKYLIIVFIIFVSVHFLPAENKIKIRTGFFVQDPLYYIDNGNITGLYKDIIQYIADKNNIELEFINSTYDDHLKNLQEGTIDILPVEINTDTTHEISNSTIYDDWHVIVTLKSRPVKSPGALSGKTIGILRDDSNTLFLKREINSAGIVSNIYVFKSIEQIKKSLLQGSIEAALLNRSDTLKIISDADYTRQPFIFNLTGIRLGFAKGINRDYKNIFEQGLKDLRENNPDIYSQIVAKYIYKSPSGRHFRISFIIVALLFLIFFYLVYIFYPAIKPISTTGRKITSSLEITSLLPIIADSIKDLLKYDYLGVGIKEDNQLTVSLFRYGSTEIYKTDSVDFNEINNVLIFTMLLKKTIVINNSEKEYLRYSSDRSFFDQIYLPGKSLVLMPVTFNNENIGILFISSKKKRVFHKGKILLLESVSRYLSIAIRNALLHAKIQTLLNEIDSDKRNILKAKKEVEYLAYHDPLTDLPNRLYLDEYLKQAIKKACRTGKFLAVIFIDMDNFKQINDTYGHQTGDKVLVIAARRFQNLLRESDTVIRFGGDEFIISLEDINSIDDLKSILNKIISTCSTPVLIDGKDFSLSFSLGISIYPFDGDSPDELIRKADIALYSVKNSFKGYWQFYNRDIQQ